MNSYSHIPLSITTHYLKRLYLKIDPYNPFSILDYDFLQKISNSSSLAFIDLSTTHLCNWNRTRLRYYEPPEKTKSVILFLIQMLTLRGLTLRNTENFPAAALSLCSGLKELEFDSISNLAPPSANDAMQRPTITTLVSLALHSGQYCLENTLAALMAGSFIAFDRLKNLSLSIHTQVEFPHMCKLLERAIYLEWVEIDGEFHAISFQHIS